MAQAPYLQFQGVTKRFGKNIILNDLNLDIPYGQITGIIGASGSGKTTLLNMLVGFIKPTKGKIYFQSREILKDIKNVSTLFGFGVQACSFYLNLSTEENLFYFGKLYGIKIKEIKKRINELLKELEIEEARKTLARNLSTGMQRRLDLACALIHKPKVLILDEPTEDLDPILRKELIRIIKKIKDSGTTVIVTSHLLNETEDLCDLIAILSEGKIIALGSPKKLKLRYRKTNLDDVFEAIINQSKKGKIQSQIKATVPQSKKGKKQEEKKPIHDNIRFWWEHTVNISKKEVEEAFKKNK